MLHAGMPNAAEYAWSTGDSEPTILVEKAGTYTVTVTAATGCQMVNETLVRYDTMGQSLDTDVPGFFVMLNPSATHFDITCPECPDAAPLRASLYNAQGQLVRTGRQAAGLPFRITVGDLPAGFYALQLWSGERYVGGEEGGGGKKVSLEAHLN
ncbi:MAG: hypothetical protein ACKVU2_02395 [Saprospiraceae bacterium]